MYYYIFDSPKNRNQRNQQERIKNILGFLGITGEIAKISPARTVEELTTMGLEKGYSTIVAVGADELVNQVGSLVARTEAVLGIIPIEASSDIINLIGTSDIKTACEILQKRPLRYIDMARIEPAMRFLTKASINSSKLLQIQAEINDFYLETQATKILIDYNLGIHFIDESRKEGWWQSFFGFDSKKNSNNKYSFFAAKKLRLRTHEIVPIKIGNIIIAKTPIAAEREKRALKIISPCAKMNL